MEYGHSLIIFLQGVDQEILPCGQGRIDSVKINPSLLMMRDCTTQDQTQDIPIFWHSASQVLFTACFHFTCRRSRDNSRYRVNFWTCCASGNLNKFGHRVAPLALVTNLATRLATFLNLVATDQVALFFWFRIWSPGCATC